jgi:hypothetical protein
MIESHTGTKPVSLFSAIVQYQLRPAPPANKVEETLPSAYI